MTTLEQAARLALELRQLANKFSEGWHDGIKIDASDVMLLADAAAALEQAEPRDDESHFLSDDGACKACEQQQAEPVICAIENGESFEKLAADFRKGLK